MDTWKLVIIWGLLLGVFLAATALAGGKSLKVNTVYSVPN